MARKNNFYPIKTIKDWQGEDWDIYEERKTSIGIMVYKGWVYGTTGGFLAYILTDEIVQFIKLNSIGDVVQQLGISRDKIICFRRELNLQKKYFKLDLKWMNQHKKELLNDSFQILNEKYGLTKPQVNLYTKYLKRTLAVVPVDSQRQSLTSLKKEQSYQLHKHEIAQMTVPEIRKHLQISYATAYRMHQQICEEFQLPNTAEHRKKHQAEYQQWLLNNKQEFFRTDITLEEIAQNFNLTKLQLIYARKRLQVLFPELGKKYDVMAWVLEHRDELFGSSRHELAKKYNMNRDQVSYRRYLLKQLQQKETQNVV